MSKRALILASALGLPALIAAAQYTPWLYWTFLPRAQMDEIVGEASGENAWKVIAEINAFNRERNPGEYEGRFFETETIAGRLRRYGLAGVDIPAYPGAGQAWVPLKGELWETAPGRRKLASMTDMLPMLASGSESADVAAELVWVGRGTPAEIQAAKVEDKILVGEGSLRTMHMEANRLGALGVVAISTSRPLFDPLQMPWSGISTRPSPGQGRGMGRPGQPEPPPPAPASAKAGRAKFAFQLPAREGEILRARLLGRETIAVRAIVEARLVEADLENVICHIPGTDPAAGEVILSAHLFEGLQKQGANDNISGSACILEVARTLQTLIGEGRLPRPRRTIRFIWGPEFSGIGRWVQANRAVMEKTLCNINMDMVGEWLSLNKAYFCLMRTTYGNPHYINDVMENYYRYLGEGNRERIQNRSTADRVPVRVVAPFGADEPFHYAIETHYGASDHEVFNDWGVGVPGIMMIAWPDQWYHTSGDVADKADPTQLKRAAVIGAAGAYTVASADAAAAVRIAGETASNATRRLGHQLVAALEKMNVAAAGTLNESTKSARWLLEAAVLNEKETLDSIAELAPGDKPLLDYIAQAKKMTEAVGAANLAVVQAHMTATAKRLGVAPVQIALTELEKKAAKIVPRPTARVRENGYAEYRKLLTAVPAEARAKYPIQGKDLAISNTSELHLLIDGRHSVLDILKLLDAQSERRSTLQAIFNYLEILKLAGLVEP